MNLKNGTILQNKYRIESVIAQGGFGITYKGFDILLNKTIAIKELFVKNQCCRDHQTQHVILSSISAKDDFSLFLSKFIKEAKVLHKFNTFPNIVHVYDVFEDNNTAYYIMDYLNGESLENYVRNKGNLSEFEAIQMVKKIANALIPVHQNNYLHLDLSPRNIIISDNKDITLIDFGVSKHYNNISGDETTSTPVAYSPGYAPIEQCKQNVSSFIPATDIYSLGAILYFMIVGYRPPESYIVFKEGFVSGIPEHLSSAIKNAIEKAMNPSYKLRPQTIPQFLELFNSNNANKDDNLLKKTGSIIITVGGCIFIILFLLYIWGISLSSIVDSFIRFFEL